MDWYPERANADRRNRGGFTLVELILVAAIVIVLCSVLFAVTGALRRKAEKASCAANMKSIFAALATYTTDNRHWPQVPESVLADEEKLSEWWIAALDEYDISEKTWMCPTYRRLSSARAKTGKSKICYIPTHFDAVSAMTPYKWGNQPWLIEIGDHHGNGVLILRPDGSVTPWSLAPPDER
jgi:type II secretory pathway pseudopilin PulG